MTQQIIIIRGAWSSHCSTRFSDMSSVIAVDYRFDGITGRRGLIRICSWSHYKYYTKMEALN